MYIIYILKVYSMIQYKYFMLLCYYNIFSVAVYSCLAAEIEKWQINKKYCLHCVTRVEYGHNKTICIKFSKNQKLQQ